MTDNNDAKVRQSAQMQQRPLMADFVDLVGWLCAFRCRLLIEADVFGPAVYAGSGSGGFAGARGDGGSLCFQANCMAGGGSDLSLASFLRFCAVAARRNSSCAP